MDEDRRQTTDAGHGAQPDRLAGRLHGPQPDPGPAENIFLRLVYMVIIWVMLSLANTVLTVATVIQFVIMLLNNKQPNERLAEFGTDLGVWIAKAARFQTGASEVKPWPWTELD
ncbi:DUF4389 domain-containing protein [Rhodovulum sp. 12E13]|uniref:DUF4389 domain-containing protein n=1 Tax=Rhodovulum sp. 12E13 TaxID=2203891 RepID=UPI000E15482A|nr:DUF4389 domain-containing protein [Rhodovulum sp. 12E13]RDC73108.1 DUF4389 domain-containing protein [Rhodovulum sp. 12E13]